MTKKIEFTPLEIGILTGLLLNNWSEYSNDPCFKRLRDKLEKIAKSYYKDNK